MVDGIPQLTVQELDRMREAGEPHRLVDVRTAEERQRASIDGSEWFEEFRERVDDLDRATPIVFHCHHGGRSQRAALHFAGLGFTEVYNLAGGIEAWAVEVDDTVPRY